MAQMASPCLSYLPRLTEVCRGPKPQAAGPPPQAAGLPPPHPHPYSLLPRPDERMRKPPPLRMIGSVSKITPYSLHSATTRLRSKVAHYLGDRVLFGMQTGALEDACHMPPFVFPGEWEPFGMPPYLNVHQGVWDNRGCLHVTKAFWTVFFLV